MSAEDLARAAWRAEEDLANARAADVPAAFAAARDAWAAWRKVARPDRHGPAVHAARGPAGEAVGHVATVDPADIPGWHIRPWRATDEPGMITEPGKISERAC